MKAAALCGKSERRNGEEGKKGRTEEEGCGVKYVGTRQMEDV